MSYCALGCKYNKMIECESRGECGKCGWNPVVRDARIERIRNSLMQLEITEDVREVQK